MQWVFLVSCECCPESSFLILPYASFILSIDKVIDCIKTPKLFPIIHPSLNINTTFPLYNFSVSIVLLPGRHFYGIIFSLQYVHSAWHVVIALSLVFLLPSHNLASQPGLAPLSPITRQPVSLSSEDAELIDVGEATLDYTMSSPVFHVTSDVDFLLTDSEEDYRGPNSNSE